MAAAMLALTQPVLAATAFSNVGGISNTRHNMTQRPASGGIGDIMDAYRNDYGQVCVYCHTPHVANATIAAPLWNRAIKATTYTTYDTLNTSTLTQEVYQPGAASLMCLSCHDGQQAVDAIMNMPGSGRYSSTPNEAFLNSWGPNPVTGITPGHADLSEDGSLSGTSCVICHQPDGPHILAGRSDFQFAAIGTDLRNEHPIGVRFPATNGSGTDWKTPNASVTRGGTTATFFDENENGRLDKAEIRMYDTGNGPLVECASCHDPHGVPSGGVGSVFNPTFLRKTINNSVVCQTCHTK
jgi:mono/diheme cytochrome c family protein